MRLVHEPADGEARTLASHVETADGLLARMRGLRFRSSFPEGEALVFPFGGVGRRTLDMLFVPFPIDAVWLVDGEVQRVARLRAWVGVASGRADTVLELPAGVAQEVAPGDSVRPVPTDAGPR